MSAGEDPPFLERAAYRRRRIADAARLMPVLGLVLFALPLMWLGPGEGGGASGPTGQSARTGIYLFACWVLLILAALTLAPRLSAMSRADDEQGPTDSAGEG